MVDEQAACPTGAHRLDERCVPEARDGIVVEVTDEVGLCQALQTALGLVGEAEKLLQVRHPAEVVLDAVGADRRDLGLGAGVLQDELPAQDRAYGVPIGRGVRQDDDTLTLGQCLVEAGDEVGGPLIFAH